jgi:uncharacterized membrane protein YkoI
MDIHVLMTNYYYICYCHLHYEKRKHKKQDNCVDSNSTSSCQSTTTSLSLATAEGAKVQMNSSRMSGVGQNQSKMMMGTSGPNITGTIPLEPTISKAISSQVHVSLANASIIAEKAVGANAHAAAVRIGVVHGFLVYMALVVDSNNNFHGVLVDAGNGKVLASTQMSMMAMMQSGMGINLMGPGMM